MTMNLDFDDLLTNIQYNMDPREEEIPTDTITPEDDPDNCLHCSIDECTNRLSFPIFPDNHYFSTLIEWMNKLPIPMMRKNQRCLQCVLHFLIVSDHPSITIVDSVMSNSLFRELGSLVTLPQACIHSDGIRQRQEPPMPPELGG